MHQSNIAKKLKTIIGNEVPDGFGQPFLKIFGLSYDGSHEEIETAAYTCSLFLSAILKKFPTTRLHTFVHNVQEKHERFSFNCDMYASIFNAMDKETLENVCLLQKDSTPTLYPCSKEDIFEAFDFYTNR